MSIKDKNSQRTIRHIEEQGSFKCWNPETVADRLNGYLNKEVYTSTLTHVVKIDSVEYDKFINERIWGKK
jgi:hypothetical protein